MSKKFDSASRVYPLQTFTIGRSSECDVIFSDKSVSRKHCTIEKLSDGTFFLRDLHSKNGTFVDEIQIKQKHISTSSQIRLGNLKLSGNDILCHLSYKVKVENSKVFKKNILLKIYTITGVLLLLFIALTYLDNVKKEDTKFITEKHSKILVHNDLMRNIEKSTVIIFAKLIDGQVSFGSGFFINKRTIVTNRHVIKNAKSIIIGNKIIGSYPAHIIAVGQSSLQDFAALDVELDNITPLQFTRKVKRNDKIYAWGYPGIIVQSINWSGLPEVVSTSGEINVIRNAATNLIIHSARISKGNSGGPLVNESGYVVGINTLLLGKGDEFGTYSISYASTDIIRFLNSYGIKYTEQ